MEWKSINFDWNHAKTFLVTAEEGSFSSGAAALGVSQPTLSRQVSALEENLGVTLFARSSKGITLTPHGQALLLYVREMARLANQLSFSATGRSEEIEGKVIVSVTDLVAMHILPDILKNFALQAPSIDIELITTDSLSDLHAREADIAIRASRPKQPELIARRLREVRAHLYASKEYIEQLGRPLDLDKLKRANYVGFAVGSPYMSLLQQYIGQPPQRSPLVIDSSIIQWEYIKKGMGIGFMVEDIGDKEPLVERVMPDSPPLSFEIWLVVHRELRSSRRLKIVYDYLAEHLSV
ncbi:LysR family transcriptional regulator [Lacimicrobium sp. SS2-24]|uniref:LysR family transcriptional regulator n=1 Tax=Lacimicrobium sp. SS2-24 TaxID=2005569 RepID=UPI00143B88F8|nr:LysR family transcriptional regulator [Lacimicrobium sp. SS2-24]